MIHTSKIPNQIISLFACSAIYKRGYLKRMRKFFSFKYPPKMYENLTDLWSVVVINGVIRIVGRGTGGDTFWQWCAAWASDFYSELTPEGRCRGFNDGARIIADNTEPYLRRLLSDGLVPISQPIEIDGHSRFASLMPILMIELKKRIPEIKIHGNQFSAFPCGNQKFADEYLSYHDTGDLKITRYVNPGDIASFKSFRRKTGLHEAGVDVDALEITLPPDSWLQKITRFLPRIWEHRPAEFFDGFIRMYSEHRELLKKMRKLI